MSNLKKNGQQMNTGESIGATGMGQKKSQILGQLLTQVMSRLLVTRETYHWSELADQSSPSTERISSDLFS